MTKDEKSAQHYDLNANERLLEIQKEIVAIEKKRIYENLSEREMNDLKEKIKFLVSEERLILEARYATQKDIKDIEMRHTENGYTHQNEEITDILKREIVEDKKIEGELKEIIQATKERKWYETWWGKILIIVAGTVILSLFTNEPINFSSLIS
jgi:hypothetical protein